MQLILLSGGSGKRLWPLSNNTRSKQFLTLLEKEDGLKESMLQRVVRQAKEAMLTKDITLVTNTSQSGIITNQLGGSVAIVTEPERRDTFPAIALAASFLKFVKKCSDKEVVVIMPCDTYTEANYFHTIRKMVEFVDANVADLILMGIIPTHPSEKYGYVIPESVESMTEYKKVAHFAEKPTLEYAKKYIAQKAYWNGGVFAFHLGYMIDIVKKYIPSNSFATIRSRYSEFPKISFDYEVAEKAGAVAVVPFTGQWKDLGTWDSLTDEIHNPIIGNAIMGAHCHNTHVINELKIPIYVDGLENVIVAACPNGFLVCDKKYSEKIKEYVEKTPSLPMYEECSWGTYHVLDYSTFENEQYSLTKSITINSGKSIPYQTYHHCSKVLTFVQGEGTLSIDGHEQKIMVGDTIVIPINHLYSIKATTVLVFIEVQVGGLLADEKDMYKNEWE